MDSVPTIAIYCFSKIYNTKLFFCFLIQYQIILYIIRIYNDIHKEVETKYCIRKY